MAVTGVADSGTRALLDAVADADAATGLADSLRVLTRVVALVAAAIEILATMPRLRATVDAVAEALAETLPDIVPDWLSDPVDELETETGLLMTGRRRPNPVTVETALAATGAAPRPVRLRSVAGVVVLVDATGGALRGARGQSRPVPRWPKPMRNLRRFRTG